MPTGIQKRLPGLYRLFAAYVNQDWDVHGATVDDAIRAFLSESKPAAVAKVCAELDTLLSMKLSDDRLDKTLTSLRCGYDWSKAGGSLAFLTHIRTKVFSKVSDTSEKNLRRGQKAGDDDPSAATR